MKISGIKIDHVVNPFEEAVAYETLLARKGVTELKLEEELPSEPEPTLVDKPSLSKLIESMKAGNKEIQEIYLRVEKLLSILYKEKSFQACSQGTFHYSKNLWDASPPLKLFYYLGDINLLDSPCVSVVGARQASQLGLKQATQVTKALVDEDYTIVSGLAKGIDTAALKVAIKKGRAIGVIGTPLNAYYPLENKEIQKEIASKHLLISHVPFYRYSKEPFQNKRFYFPKRNITMSAISKATVIIEASETSGTHSQARAALKQGRKLFIMDSCFDKYSWPARFVAQGAIRISDPDDLIKELKKINE